MALNTRKSRLTVTVLGVAILCASVAIIEGRSLHRAIQFNTALTQEDWARAGAHKSGTGTLARALAAQQGGAYPQALEHYVSLREGDDVELAKRATFNTGTVYLQWGLEQMRDADHAAALPLVELAKETFRRLLRRNPGLWAARYNLERALQIAPDPDPLAPAVHGMPERSPRALGSIRAEAELP